MLFAERVRAGQVADIGEEFDDAIGAWHSAETTVPLHEWLGMTEEEYGLAVSNPPLAIPPILAGELKR